MHIAGLKSRVSRGTSIDLSFIREFDSARVQDVIIKPPRALSPLIFKTRKTCASAQASTDGEASENG